MVLQDINLADPTLWIIAGIVLVVLAFLLIYFRLLVGEVQQREKTY